MVDVDPSLCCYCGGCVAVCPEDAITLAETRLIIDNTCTDCGLCLSSCPVAALSGLPGHTLQQAHASLQSRYDVIVVGSGPGGSFAAWKAAELGLSVLLLEKRQEIGSPVRCAEGVPHDGLAQLVEIEPSWISATVRRARVLAVSSGKVLHDWQGSGGVGYVLERRVFDRALAEFAALAGAQVRAKTPVTGLLLDRGRVQGVIAAWRGRDVEVEAGIVIAADGVESRVGAWAGLDTQLRLRDTMVCAQYLLAGIDWDAETVGYWIDHRVAPGGYAWVFPKGDGRANVGLGIQADHADEAALALLQRFIDSEPRLAQGSPVTLVAGSVPVSAPCRPMVAKGLMLVGDAGRQVDPLTGGGIVNAMTAGRLAAQAAARAVDTRGAKSRALAEYEAEFSRVIGRRLERNYRLRARFPPEQRTSERFVGLFALAVGGK